MAHDSSGTALPFKYNKDDTLFLKAYEIKAIQKRALADILGDLEGLGIEFGPEDFVGKEKLLSNQEA